MRIAVIGCGSIGYRHIGNLLALGERDILIHDADAETQWRAGIDPCIRGYVSLDDLYALGQPEAVLICTPPDSHMRLAADARDEGVWGIFIEKPLALGPVDAGAWADCVTMVGCNMRFHVGPLAIKRWLNEGAMGEVLSARLYCGYHLSSIRADYATSYAANTGALLDIGSHEADIATWLLGPATLKGAVVRPASSIVLPDTDGTAELLLGHESGAVSSIGVSWLRHNYKRGIEIVGTRATADWDYSRATAVLRYSDGEGLSRGTQEDWNECYCRELAHFLTCVRENRPTCNPISQAAKTLNLLLEAKTRCE